MSTTPIHGNVVEGKPDDIVTKAIIVETKPAETTITTTKETRIDDEPVDESKKEGVIPSLLKIARGLIIEPSDERRFEYEKKEQEEESTLPTMSITPIDDNVVKSQPEETLTKSTTFETKPIETIITTTKETRIGDEPVNESNKEDLISLVIKRARGLAIEPNDGGTVQHVKDDGARGDGLSVTGMGSIGDRSVKERSDELMTRLSFVEAKPFGTTASTIEGVSGDERRVEMNSVSDTKEPFARLFAMNRSGENITIGTTNDDVGTLAYKEGNAMETSLKAGAIDVKLIGEESKINKEHGNIIGKDGLISRVVKHAHDIKDTGPFLAGMYDQKKRVEEMESGAHLNEKDLSVGGEKWQKDGLGTKFSSTDVKSIGINNEKTDELRMVSDKKDAGIMDVDKRSELELKVEDRSKFQSAELKDEGKDHGPTEVKDVEEKTYLPGMRTMANLVEAAETALPISKQRTEELTGDGPGSTDSLLHRVFRQGHMLVGDPSFKKEIDDEDKKSMETNFVGTQVVVDKEKIEFEKKDNLVGVTFEKEEDLTGSIEERMKKGTSIDESDKGSMHQLEKKVHVISQSTEGAAETSDEMFYDAYTGDDGSGHLASVIHKKAIPTDVHYEEGQKPLQLITIGPSTTITSAGRIKTKLAEESTLKTPEKQSSDMLSGTSDKSNEISTFTDDDKDALKKKPSIDTDAELVEHKDEIGKAKDASKMLKIKEKTIDDELDKNNSLFDQKGIRTNLMSHPIETLNDSEDDTDNEDADSQVGDMRKWLKNFFQQIPQNDESSTNDETRVPSDNNDSLTASTSFSSSIIKKPDTNDITMTSDAHGDQSEYYSSTRDSTKQFLDKKQTSTTDDTFANEPREEFYEEFVKSSKNFNNLLTDPTSEIHSISQDRSETLSSSDTSKIPMKSINDAEETTETLHGIKISPLTSDPSVISSISDSDDDFNTSEMSIQTIDNLSPTFLKQLRYYAKNLVSDTLSSVLHLSTIESMYSLNDKVYFDDIISSFESNGDHITEAEPVESLATSSLIIEKCEQLDTSIDNLDDTKEHTVYAFVSSDDNYGKMEDMDYIASEQFVYIEEPCTVKEHKTDTSILTDSKQSVTDDDKKNEKPTTSSTLESSTGTKESATKK